MGKVPTDEEFARAEELRKRWSSYTAANIYSKIDFVVWVAAIIIPFNFWIGLITFVLSLVYAFISVFYKPTYFHWGDDLYSITHATKYYLFDGRTDKEDINIACTYKDEKMRSATRLLRSMWLWTFLLGMAVYFNTHPYPHLLA